MEVNNFVLILGSQSPRRKELLSWLNIEYKIITADIEEISKEKTPSNIAIDIAIQKARAVFKKCEKENNFIVSADTIVVLNDKIFGKPKDVKDAKNILTELSGKTHQVITGVCFIYNGREHCFYDQTDVTFNIISPQLLQNYLNTNDSLDKAGAYGIQGPGLTFISKINGSYSNVVGFPLDKVISELQSLFGNNWYSKFNTTLS
jgi:septum formation protein